MDLERGLISKIISTGQIDAVISKGVEADHFADSECRDVYLRILDHTRDYKTPPSTPAFKDEFPDFELVHVSDSLEYVIDRFIVLVKRRLADEYILDLAAAADDPHRAENIELEFLEVARKLATVVPSTQVARFSDMGKRIDEYERRKAAGEKTGVPFGIPTLDRWTGGIQPHEFVSVTAFSGVGKSTLCQVIAFNAYVQGFTPLIISLEMEKEAILRKFDALAAALDYQKIKHLDLPPDQIANWRAVAARVADKAHDIPVIDSIRHCTPDKVFAETVRHKPDLVVIDYISLMKSGHPSRNTSLWQSLTEITQDLKQNARTLKIPIIAAAQMNRRGKDDGGLENIGYSISVAQDSDIVISLVSSDEMRDANELDLLLVKNRDGRVGPIKMVWDHDTLTFREKTMKDMYGRPGVKGGDS